MSILRIALIVSVLLTMISIFQNIERFIAIIKTDRNRNIIYPILANYTSDCYINRYSAIKLDCNCNFAFPTSSMFTDTVYGVSDNYIKFFDIPVYNQCDICVCTPTMRLTNWFEKHISAKYILIINTLVNNFVNFVITIHFCKFFFNSIESCFNFIGSFFELIFDWIQKMIRYYF